MPDAYKQLAQHLNRLPGGYPPTESGVELRILEKLFSEEEARVAMALSMMPEPVESVAAKLGSSPEELEPILVSMSRKGLIFSMQKELPLFMAAQFVIGIWEYHVNDLDPELIAYFNEYVPYLAKQWKELKTNQLRVIPVSRSVSAEMDIMPYEAAESIIRAQSKIVVAPCICRREHRMAGKGCDLPLEACLVFGSGAFYYQANDLGRVIDQTEALEILKKGVDAGLVLQPGNAKKAMNICMCCGCCCQVLKNIKQFPQPARYVNTSYFAVVDEDLCVGCGTCETRCQMDAVSISETAEIDPDRCIGCGVCVPTCETGALSLSGKPENEQWDPPSTVYETYIAIARERGLI